VDIHNSPDLGWSKLVTGPIVAVDVASDHLDLLRRPAVERVAEALEGALG
jgi:thioesterase domain-containing protein